MEKIEILGVNINIAKKEKILEYLAKSVKNPKTKIKIFTPNPEIITYAIKHPSLKKSLNQGQILIPDGIGIVMASKILGKKKLSRITGIDFMEDIIEAVENEQISLSKQPVVIGFLGGQEGVAEQAAKCLQKKYPKLNIGYASSEWDKAKMIYSDIDILFVAFGFPRQEEWINKNLEKIPVKIAMGVGGSFDILSGRIPRAPKLIQSLGLEWLFRLLIQPWRWKRQLRLLEFSALILKEALSDRLRFHKNKSL